MEDKFKELLLKYRKGATAGFNTTTWFKVLTLVGGWTVVVNQRGTDFTITAPNGKSFHLVKQEGYRVVTFYRFGPWAKEQGLMDQVLAKLGMPSYEAEKAARKVRKDENVGTCACCFGMFKLSCTSGVELMVLHGYKRPGTGYIIGNCPGINYQPYELSCAGTVIMLKHYVQPAMDGLKKKLTFLQEAVEFYVDRFQSKEPRKVAMADYDFKSEKESEIRHLEWQMRHVQRDIDFLNDKITNWKRMPLPGQEKVFEEQVKLSNEIIDEVIREEKDGK